MRTMKKKDYTKGNLTMIKKSQPFNKSGNYGTRFCYLCNRGTLFTCLRCGNYVCSVCGFGILYYYFLGGRQEKYGRNMRNKVIGRLCKKCNKEINLVKDTDIKRVRIM